MVDLAVGRRNLAGQHAPDPFGLLALELVAVRHQGYGGPFVRAAPVGARAEGVRGEQRLLLGGGEAQQPGQRGAQLDRAGHDASCFQAVKIRLYVTRRVIAAKPTVCSRVRNAAGSTGL